MCAAQHGSHTGGVIARIDSKIFGHAVNQINHTANVATGFLDADDIGDFSQAQHGVVVHVDHSAAGHVVHNHRNIRRFGNSSEVAVDTFLRRFIVVRHHRQRGICAGANCRTRQLDGFTGAVHTGTGNHRNAAVGKTDGCLDHFNLFRHAERGALAGGTNGDNGIGAVGNMPINQALELFVVDTAIFTHRSDDGDKTTG